MSALYVVAAILAASLVIYLVIALLAPERLQ